MRLLPALLLLCGGILANLVWYGLARVFGLLGPSIIVASNGAPIGVGAVAASTAMAGIAALLVRFVLARILVRWAKSERPAFAALAGGVLILSFFAPAQALAGEQPADLLLLGLMHVTAAGFSWLASEFVGVQPRSFGEVNYVGSIPSAAVAVVTGATSGIGQAVARQLAERGVVVIGVGRDVQRARELESASRRIRVLEGNLEDRDAVDRLANTISTLAPGGIDILVHCAGVLLPRAANTPLGIDRNFAVSFLGRFALTQRLSLSSSCRIVIVGAAERGRLPTPHRRELRRREHIKSGLQAHGSAQLANDLWVGWLARRGFRVFGYGPGPVHTRIRRAIPLAVRVVLTPFFAARTKPADTAAKDVIRLLFDDRLPSSGFANRSGLFTHDPFVADAERQDAVIDLAQELLGDRGGVVPSPLPS